MKMIAKCGTALAGCLLALTTIPPQVAYAAPTSDGVKVQQLMARIADGQRTLSTSEKALVQKEFGAATTTLEEQVTVEPMAFSGCWSKAIEVTVYVGITKAKVFTVGQTTKVCVTSGSVSSVTVPNKYLLLHGYVGVYSKGVTSGTNDVNWEGRGVAIGTVAIGVNGWDISKTSQCVQMRLNADGVHYQGSTSCNI